MSKEIIELCPSKGKYVETYFWQTGQGDELKITFQWSEDTISHVAIDLANDFLKIPK